jgi:Cu(I)/Ag(I) efflux system membrane fusion protein
MAESDGEEAPAAAVRVAGVVRWALIALMAAAAVGAWIRYARVESPFAQSADQYQCPMHPSVLQDRPGECAICGMALVRVAHAPRRAPQKPAASAVERPAGEPGGSVPGLVTVDIGPERTQLVGMRTAKATRNRLTTQLRSVGFVSADDSSVAIATSRFSGWVEEVAVAQGQHVDKGEILATISGPELLTAQQVYLAARGWAAKQKGPAPGAPASSVEEENNALQRLGIAQRDIERVARGNRPLPTMPIRAPISGHVARRNVLKGLYVQPGTELFQIVDLSRVWVVADVYEQDARRLQLGQGAQLFLAAYPGESFSSKVDFIYPALDPETHTLQARMQLPNPELKLRPGMYGDVVIDVPTAETLTVPAEAVVDTGVLQYVFVAGPNGRFNPRVVRLGDRAAGRVQVLEGLDEDDVVVTTANFLVDSESRLRAAVEILGPPPEHDRNRGHAATTARSTSGQQP